MQGGLAGYGDFMSDGVKVDLELRWGNNVEMVQEFVRWDWPIPIAVPTIGLPESSHENYTFLNDLSDL